MQGFGGCFNELGWDALQALSETDRKAVMDEIFCPENCNFNYGRVPIARTTSAWSGIPATR